MSASYFCPQSAHQICVDRALRQAEAICRKRKLRLTPLRRRVLELIWMNHQPVGAYQVLDLLKGEGSAAPPTVYRALEFLLSHGLIHRINSMNAYIGCSHVDRAHLGQFLICDNCQGLVELDDDRVSKAIQGSAERAGFTVQQQIVEITGLCPDCRQEISHE